jgi:hypothetical protein
LTIVDQHVHLGGYNPSTPYQLGKKRKAPASRPIAGPSSAKVPRITKTRKQKSTRESPVIVEDDDNDDDDDDVPKVVQPVTRNGTIAKDPPSVMANGKPASRAKGKRKAGPLTNGHKSDPELVVIDELDDDDPTLAPPLQLAKRGKAGSIENGGYSLEKLRLERDLVRLFNISSISYEVTQDLHAVQREERTAIRTLPSAYADKKYRARGGARIHESSIRRGKQR